MARRNGFGRPGHAKQCYIALITILIAVFVLIVGVRFSGNSLTGTSGSDLANVEGKFTGRTIVLYVFTPEDQANEANLRFFLKHGLGGGPNVQYVIVLDAQTNLTETSLPELPSTAQYRTYKGRCNNKWGRWGWTLMSVDKQASDYFIFVDASVRGPYLPVFLQGTVHWTELYVKRITDTVKLVGSYVTCEKEGIPDTGSDGRPLQLNAYIKGGVYATDRVGLKLVEKDGRVLSCDNAEWEKLYYSDMGMSSVMLNAGYNIDSFMLRYAGVNWLDRKNWECNARFNPVGEHWYDGTSLNPLEVVFVPMNAVTLGNEWSFAVMARKYEKWLTLQGNGTMDISSNQWTSNPWATRHMKVAYMRSRGIACFDHRFYLQQNPDLKVLIGPVELWEHFVNNGQFEGRPVRWSCEDKRKLPWED